MTIVSIYYIPLLLSISRKAFKDLGKLSLIYLLGKVFQVAGKVLSITFKSGKAFENSRKGFFPKIPWERKGKGFDSVLPTNRVLQTIQMKLMSEQSRPFWAVLAPIIFF